jgi:hypothetical protein
MSPLYFVILFVSMQHSLADDYYCANYLEVNDFYGFSIDCRYNSWNWCSVDMCPMECSLCVYGESFMEGCTGTSPGQCKPCTKCGPGTSDSTGCFSYVGYPSQDSTCVPCVAGFYSNDVHNYFCQYCPAGTFSATGSSVCDLCAPGTYQVGYGYTNVCIPCEACPGGYYKAEACAGASSGCAPCSQCGPGKIVTGGCFTVGEVSVDTECRMCGAGTYSDGAHNMECRTCPPATYQTSAGASSCLPCGRCQNGFYPLGCGNSSAGVCLRCMNAQ